MRQKSRFRSFFQSVAMAAGMATVCLAGLPGSPAAQPTGPAALKTVVIDPGHGGSDTGAKGTAGTVEKAFTLRLARLVENRLKGRYRVILTRTDDYAVPRPERTGRANNARADLFISLHAAGSYSPARAGLMVYYYTQPAVKLPEQAPAMEPVGTPWRLIQKPHIPASSLLAQRVCDRARPLAVPHPAEVQSAPAAVLAGADMPAILIEAGYLTNPKQEKNLNDNKYLFRLATAISQGIDDYVEHPEGIAATDLRE